MEETPPNPRRQPKGDKRLRTRAKLLEAARELIREKGYARTTLQDVAQRAGMTSGAIYGNFKNRDELFVSLAEVYWAPIRPKVKAGAAFREVMQALAAATLAALPDRNRAAVGRLTGMAYALTQDELRARVRDVTAQSYAAGASWLRGAIDERELPMAPEHLVRVIHALTEGLVFQRLLTPELVPDEVFYEAFAALASPSAREYDILR
jgi:AcrR family transcriptional regulator